MSSVEKNFRVELDDLEHDRITYDDIEDDEVYGDEDRYAEEIEEFEEDKK